MVYIKQVIKKNNVTQDSLGSRDIDIFIHCC